MESARQTDIPTARLPQHPPGHLLVVSGPSGVGKGTLVAALLRNPDLRLTRSISCTTRPPRPGERDGVDYFLLDDPTFVEEVHAGQFLEHARYGHYRYGTPRQFVDDMLARGQDVILVIDVQGALQIKQNRADAVFIFILPPTMEELAQRLTRRDTESADDIRERLSIAHQELKDLWHYDYQVLNDQVEPAVQKLQAIVIAERCRISRRQEGDSHEHEAT